MLTHLNASPTKPKRVVVIGSNGFVGKSLIPYLKEKGIATLALSRQECDLLNDESIDFLEQTFQPEDQVVFLTAITPDKGRGVKAMVDNMNIAENIGKALQKSPVAQFILMSSEAIYPITFDLINEKTSLAPADLYGSMHLAREIHFSSLNLPLAIVRSTLIYGEGDTHSSYGPNRFLKEAMNQGTITLFGGGEEKRSHIFIEDVVKFIDQVLTYKSIGGINLCPGPSISFMDAAQTIKDALSTKIEIITKSRASEITHRYFDNTYLYQAFSDFSFTDIKDGIRKTIEETSK